MSNTPAQEATKDDPWFRPGVAIKRELRPGLERVVVTSGANKLSVLIATLAAEPERAGELLAPLVKEVRERTLAADPVKSRKAQLKKVMDMIKSGQLSPEDLARAVESAEKNG